MTASIPALLQPLKDRLAAAREWDVCDSEQTVRAETGEIIYDRSGYDRSEWVGEYRPIAEFIAAAPTDQTKLIAALEGVLAVADRWEEDFPHKAWQVRSAASGARTCSAPTATASTNGGTPTQAHQSVNHANAQDNTNARRWKHERV